MEEFRNQVNIPHHKDITLQDAILITSASPMQDVASLSELPTYMLSKIMMLDCASRQLPISFPIDTGSNPPKSVVDILYDETQSWNEKEDTINPMDVFLFLFIQCQSNFRQTFATQVSKCQLSLPLIASYPTAQNPTFYVFALKTLDKVYFNVKNVSTSFSVTEEMLPIVSFIRIGNCDKSQKSDMLNRVLGISGYFYDRNQLGNCKRRLFLNGNVDIAWFLPKIEESRENVICNEPFVILNLRGDAFKFPIQRKFITTVSSFVYVFIAINQCDRNMSENLEDFHSEYGAKAIYLLHRGEKKLEKESLKIPEFLKDFSDTVIFLEGKNLGEESNILGKNISTRIRNEGNIIKISLLDCIPIARRLLLRVDVDVSNIESSQSVVDKIITHLFNSSCADKETHPQPLAALKRSMLPLQGSYWSRWASYTRELHSFELKNCTDLSEHKKGAEENLREEREKQIQILLEPSSLLTDILNHCRTFCTSGDFYTMWKLLQNEFNSLSKLYLPPLYEEYRRLHELSISSELGKKDHNEEKQKELKDSLRKAAKAIAESSFGLEHIFRELGQFFEAYEYNNTCEFTDLSILEKKLSFQFEKLPDIAASLLIEGHAFEILDGDVNHVPVTWVTGVLRCLAYKIGTNKRVFVLSVLGIQSTGKSTLLNTMFGANFPVSSGRCTRGIFIQLIPLDTELASKLGYDYVILLDTEGLRAPELSINSSYRRDNELATFAIGLGDATVINMSGEGHSDVQDILQIIIFAFIRMRESYSKPRCMFVHQNVPDPQAHTKLLVARSNLLKTLDKMTQCAAHQENKTDFYKRFCDVIEFRPEKEVFYFPGLFDGEQPLHRIAPAYAKKAANLRENVLKCFIDTDKQFQTVLAWSEKLTRLWEAVLQENFVFSYRNALEVTARFKLDCELSSWYSNYIRSWISKKAESLNLLFNDDLAEVDTTVERLLSELREESNSPTIESDSENKLMNFFFVDHDNKDIFIQWKANTSLYIQAKRDAHIQKMEKEYKIVSKVQKTRKEIDNVFFKFRREIVSKVRSLFHEMKLQGKSLKDKSLVKTRFQRMWDEWRAEIEVDATIPERDISKDVQRALSESPIIKSMSTLSSKKDIIMDTSRFVFLGSQDFSYLSKLSSHNDSDYFAVRDLIAKKSSYISIFAFLSKKVSTNTKLDQFTTLINILNSQCERKIREYSSSFVKNECPYDPNVFFVVIELCYNILTNHNLAEENNVQSSLQITPDFKFNFILFQCCKAIPSFQTIQKNFLSKISLNRKFISLESQLKNTFTNLCEGIETEYCAKEMASITMQGLQDYLTDSVSPVLIQLFKEDLVNQSDYNSRASLILRILKDLVRDKRFENYISYITKPTNFIIEYVRKQISKYLKNNNVLNRVKTVILEEVNSLVDLYIQASKDECPDLVYSVITLKTKIWGTFIKGFYSKIKFKTRNVSVSDLDVLDIYSISEYGQFCDVYSTEMKKLVKDLNWLKWISTILKEDDMIYTAITDPLLECQALCPFCKELCQLAAGDHEHYCGTFHRPKGVTGWHHYNSREISVKDCASSIKKQGRFRYNDKLYNYVDYKNVNEHFNSWKILGSDYIDSKYWQWVLYHFKKRFLEYYDIVDNPDIQPWRCLKEVEVISDLENHYKSEIFRLR